MRSLKGRRKSKPKTKRKPVKVAVKIKGTPGQVHKAMRKMTGDMPTAAGLLSGR